MALKSVLERLFLNPATLRSVNKCTPVIFSPLNVQLSLISNTVHLLKNAKKTKLVRQVDGFDESKAKLVSALNFKSVEDALPFYNLPFKTLAHIHKVTKNDELKGVCKNRLYYISLRLQVPPPVLSEKLAKRPFIYSLSFEWIEKALDVLLEMGVSSNRILRDLWVLKYHHDTIRARLQSVKDLGIEKLCPWMVRCTDAILQRFINITQETKDILGDTKTTQIYLAHKLNTSVDNIEELCIRMPALKTIRVTKVKSFLDFLFDEGFAPEDIAKKPRVLCASQNTVKDRIEKLRTLGLSNINLNVLCKSKKGFKKYCDSIQSVTLSSKDSDNYCDVNSNESK